MTGTSSPRGFLDQEQPPSRLARPGPGRRCPHPGLHEGLYAELRASLARPLSLSWRSWGTLHGRAVLGHRSWACFQPRLPSLVRTCGGEALGPRVWGWLLAEVGAAGRCARQARLGQEVLPGQQHNLVATPGHHRSAPARCSLWGSARALQEARKASFTVSSPGLSVDSRFQILNSWASLTRVWMSHPWQHPHRPPHMLVLRELSRDGYTEG